MNCFESQFQDVESLVDCDGSALLCRSFYSPAQASHYYTLLHDNLAWQEETLMLFGKHYKVPRLVCWYGDPGADYQYSGVIHRPLPWEPTLQVIKQDIEALTRQSFNSVLANFYRDGQDSMGWHSDNEKELGLRPVIASLSLGSSRAFKLRHNNSRQTIRVILKSGDLLMMTGPLQTYWQHSISKTRASCSGRINLTFRSILS